MYNKALELFPDKELLSLEMAQLHILPHSLKRVGGKNQHPPPKRRINQPNWSQITRLISPPKVAKLVKTLGNILNPYGAYGTSIVTYMGGESFINELKTWRQPGKQFQDMSANQLTSQEDKVKQFNVANAPKFAAETNFYEIDH